ncbi:MAG: hypothetical protein PHQ46_12600 [Negativicutes bacterium]|nr:hypothetical protein [Negativicutes bacterium]
MDKVINYFQSHSMLMLIGISLFLGIYFVGSTLYKSMAIPFYLPLICLLYTLLYFYLIYFMGIKIISVFIRLVKSNSEADIRSLIFIDLFIIGLFSLITIGVIGGLFGFLSWKFYLIIILLLSIVPTDKSISSSSFKKASKTDAVFLAAIVLVFVFFLYNQLVQSMYAVDIVADIFVQTLPQIKDIVTSGQLIPSILAKENRMHEYFYPILILIPAIGKDFFGSIASVSFGIQVLSVFVIYFGATRLYGRFNAILATAFITLLSLSMYLVYAGLVPLPKIYLRFFNIMYAVSFVYLFLYVKFNNKIFLWLSVLSVAFLSGTTLVGLYFTCGTYLAFLLLLYLKRISKKDLAIFTIVIICFFITPKIINYIYSHSFFDLITILFLNLQNNTFMYPEFISNIDRFFMEYHWYGHGNRGNSVFLTTELIFKLLFNHAGIFVIISTLIIIFFRKDTLAKIVVIYNLHMLVILYSSINVRSSHTTFVVLWHSFVFLNLIYWLPLILEKFSILKERKYLGKSIIIVVIMIISSLYLYSEISFRGFFKNNYYYKPIIASSVNTGKKITASRSYLSTEEFKNLKSKIKKDELVFNFAVSYPYLFLSEYLEYTPIFFTSIINEALYYDDPAKTIRILKQLKIRYIFVTKEINDALPRPTIFKEQYAGKYLRIAAINKVPESVIKLYEKERTSPHAYKNDAGILLEILYSPSEKNDMQVIKLANEIKFRDDEMLKKVLKTNELTEEVLDRIVSYLQMTKRYF